MRGERSEEQQRSTWRLVLLVGGGVLVLYYVFVVASMRNRDASAVDLDDGELDRPADRVTMQVEAAELDPASGSFDVRLRPVPRGALEAEDGGTLRRALEVQVSSPGQPPASFDFPAGQLVDPVATTLSTSTGAHRFPFDRPEAGFRIEAFTGDRPVPVDLEMEDATEGWSIAASARPAGAGDGVQVDVRAGREMLAISFAVFYITGIGVVALITVAIIGAAIARAQVDFDQVIWLGAMLVAIPAVRNEMPGVPPVGTAVDLFVFLPSVVIVAAALLASIVVLAINEARSESGAAAPAED